MTANRKGDENFAFRTSRVQDLDAWGPSLKERNKGLRGTTGQVPTTLGPRFTTQGSNTTSHGSINRKGIDATCITRTGVSNLSALRLLGGTTLGTRLSPELNDISMHRAKVKEIVRAQRNSLTEDLDLGSKRTKGTARPAHILHRNRASTRNHIGQVLRTGKKEWASLAN